ncbi:hypothetical protein SAMN02746009_04180 [Hymenobacter psychrotolerans DSM 18569]|uniref:MORN repeat variant n=2 Tax=Hymenobacter psychrotolerans TaxID=344998 RepID=A0A1M7H938_9BACT|nr:hypothetical protein SAMN02746009_04180 [Hymenobacter psychrotolerans DSM 18569]
MLVPYLGLGQSGKSVYKNLVTKKILLGSSSKKPEGIGYGYFINGKRVDKIAYDSFQGNSRYIKECCPCILQMYNSDGRLVNEGVRCTDAPVGWWKAYYTTGNLKESGQFKENDSGNWDNLCDRGYCGVKVGRWTYFDEQGKTLYSEDWKEGEFVRQLPEQLIPELWKVDFLLQGQNAKKLPLTLEQISELQIVSYYKNKIRPEPTIKLLIEASGHRPFVREIVFAELKSLDARKLLLASGIPADKQPRFTLEVFNSRDKVYRLFLNIVR